MVGNQHGTAAAITASLTAIWNPTSPRDREVAEWEAASDIARHPSDYACKRFLFAEWDRIVPWFNMDPDALRFTALSNQELFGKYRVSVLDYEGACAKQLDALAWAARTLYAMRDKPGANTTRIDNAMTPIAGVLSDSWGVPDNFLKLSLDRAWSTTFTRRYDLLPRSWRLV